MAMPCMLQLTKLLAHKIVACILAVCCTTNAEDTHGAQVVTVSARYIMHNASDEPLQYGQRGSRIVWQLAPAASTPFHWCTHPLSGCTLRQQLDRMHAHHGSTSHKEQTRMYPGEQLTMGWRAGMTLTAVTSCACALAPAAGIGLALSRCRNDKLAIQACDQMMSSCRMPTMTIPVMYSLLCR